MVGEPPPSSVPESSFLLLPVFTFTTPAASSPFPVAPPPCGLDAVTVGGRPPSATTGSSVAMARSAAPAAAPLGFDADAVRSGAADAGAARSDAADLPPTVAGLPPSLGAPPHLSPAAVATDWPTLGRPPPPASLPPAAAGLPPLWPQAGRPWARRRPCWLPASRPCSVLLLRDPSSPSCAVVGSTY
ncbi:hypothetical protein GUJ93_ZPchr0008g14188 [Zizania palustris]|uniref:Uncharacterized protein n=1 Tax=Zizania palustris TaxID=103762 RepID=A0A8J5RX27_ZIZPA|nr:hypothetical protein GUJ93_ZPchr0008g14188 [Zizania palustris]